MNNKIIGFTISNKPIDHQKIDVFKVGLKTKFFKHAGLYIYLWGIGNIDKCFISNNVISLSFPLHNRLDDRNVLITLKENGVEIENDWLGSIPIFYNTKKIIISTLINKTFTKEDGEIDPDGLNNYLDFGYCVLEHSPFRNVRFMRYFSKIEISDTKIHISKKDDLFLNNSKEKVTTEIVTSSIKRHLNTLACKVRGDIILPTSGGLDSRLLNLLIKNKERIRSYTYGLSPQTKATSFEVAKAKKLSEILGTKWKEIKLLAFHKYYKEWFELFGCSTYLSGMYHIEFYKKIKKYMPQNNSVLSGICNETWSGQYPPPVVNNPGEVIEFGNTHGINSDSKISKFNKDNKLNLKFFNLYKTIPKSNKNKFITLVRFRIMLLSFTLKVPDYLGYPSWTPFLNFKIADKMLSISDKERKDEKWLKDYFDKEGILLEKMVLGYPYINTLDQDASKYYAIPNIEINILKPLIKGFYLFKIRLNYSKLVINNFNGYIFLNKLIGTRILGSILRKCRFNNINYMKPFTEVTVLKSIEMTHKMLVTKK